MALFRQEHTSILQEYYPGQTEYKEVLESLASFLEAKVLPHSAGYDTGTEKMAAARKALLENGICQLAYPKEYGGLGLPFGLYTLAVEFTGYADASMALSVAIHNTVAEGVSRFASAEVKKRLLPDIISGRRLAAFCLTEPTSGSDAKAMGTKARRDGDGFSINGSKMYITNAGEADVYFVFSKTERGPSCFLVEKGNAGLSFGEDLRKLGMRGSRTSEVRFEDCKVGHDALVGEEGEGFEYAKAMLNASRIAMGSLCVGIAEAAYAKAIDYSKQRKSFGESISEFQLTREKIADMRTGISAGRLLCMHASRLREMGEDYSSEASQAKVFSTEMSASVCDSAIQIFGGHGYTTDDVHRHWRDARLLTIGEGTSEVLRLLIARRELARQL